MEIETEGLCGNVHMLCLVDNWKLTFHYLFSVSSNLKKHMLTYFQIQEKTRNNLPKAKKIGISKYFIAFFCLDVVN